MAAAETPRTRPRLLIGSSSADRGIATALQAGLDDLVQVTLWSRGTFEPGSRFVEGILDASREFDFGAFVVSPDDVKRTKRTETEDQVLLALGMFLGAIGRQRTFIVCPTEAALDLPSDLRGVVTATYPPARAHGVPPAVASACAIIKEQILRLVPAAAKAPSKKQQARAEHIARRRRRSTLGTAFLTGPRRVLKIADISMTGALLESYGELPEGQMLDMDLALENGTRLRVSAKVVRNQHPQWGKTGGVGVSFLHFEGDARDHLARYIDSDPKAAAEHEIEADTADVPAR